MKHIRSYLLNASLLFGVSLLMRTVSVAFNAYVAGAVGAEAMGLYSLLSGIYGFAVTLATSGIHITTVRMVTDAMGKEDHGRVRECLAQCLGYAAAFSAAASLLLFFGADFIGTVLLADERTVRSLRFLSLTLIPISLSNVCNGYFTAVRRSWKNAVIQVLEQAVRIATVSFLLSFLIPYGVEFACAALAIGGAAAECISFFISFAAFLRDKKRTVRRESTVCRQSVRQTLLQTALPIAFSAYARSGLISIEHMLIPRGLSRFGGTQSGALAQYGLLQSMALPIVLFPAALIIAFSGLLIPEITECCTRNNHRQIRYICERVTQLALLFSIGVAGIMICFSEELGAVIYPGTDAGRYIRLLAPLIPVMYIDTTVDSMLKGLGEQLYCMTVNIIDSLLSVLLVWILLPRFGIMGYVVTIYITELINATCSITRLLQKSGMHPHLMKWVSKPLLCVVGATCAANLFFHQFPFFGENSALRLTVHIVFTAVLYLALARATYSFDAEDTRWAFSIFKKAPPIRDRCEERRLPSGKYGRHASQSTYRG